MADQLQGDGIVRARTAIAENCVRQIPGAESAGILRALSSFNPGDTSVGVMRNRPRAWITTNPLWLCVFRVRNGRTSVEAPVPVSEGNL